MHAFACMHTCIHAFACMHVFYLGLKMHACGCFCLQMQAFANMYVHACMRLHAQYAFTHVCIQVHFHVKAHAEAFFTACICMHLFCMHLFCMHGFVCCNCLRLFVCVQSLCTVIPLRNFLLLLDLSNKQKFNAVLKTLSELMRKIFNRKNFKGIVSPHEFLQVFLYALLFILFSFFVSLYSFLFPFYSIFIPFPPFLFLCIPFFYLFIRCLAICFACFSF